MTIASLFGIEQPLLQAPMAGVQGSALAIAVSNAGGLGALPCALLSPTAIRAELERIRSATSRPYNVNFFCHSPPTTDPERAALWRTALQPFYTELGVDASAAPSATTRSTFNQETLALLSELRPPVVSFHFGLPAAELVAQVKSWGSKVLSSATTVAEALWLEAQGVDAVIAQGIEAGGHRGMFLSQDLTTQVGTFALLPQIVRRVRIPVIAAGGIADAHGVSAAMRLGAAGVQVGTAFLLCPEATTSAVHRAALSSPTAVHTALTNVLTGRPARSIVNRIIRELGPMNAAAPAFPLAAAPLAPLRAAAERNGSGAFSPLWAGQHVACQEKPAAEVTRQLAGGFSF